MNDAAASADTTSLVYCTQGHEHEREGVFVAGMLPDVSDAHAVTWTCTTPECDGHIIVHAAPRDLPEQRYPCSVEPDRDRLDVLPPGATWTEGSVAIQTVHWENTDDPRTVAVHQVNLDRAQVLHLIATLTAHATR